MGVVVYRYNCVQICVVYIYVVLFIDRYCCLQIGVVVLQIGVIYKKLLLFTDRDATAVSSGSVSATTLHA